MRLEGRVALVTGAARNIGAAIATTFAAEGAQLVIATNSDSAGLSRTAEACRASGASVLEVFGDVGVPADCATMVGEGLERYGRIDVLINTVAIRPAVRFAD